MIYQYASIVAGNAITLEYPEPAKTMKGYLAVFSLQLIQFAPPKCTQVCIVTPNSHHTDCQLSPRVQAFTRALIFIRVSHSLPSSLSPFHH